MGAFMGALAGLLSQDHPGRGLGSQGLPVLGDPQPADQAANRKRLGRLGSRPPPIGREGSWQRNTVCINKLKQWRGPATRYDKTVTTCRAGLRPAAVFIWSAQ
ncbi:hypothetical protein ACFXAO_04080 [Streptomyces lavendulae]|uniref:hypothetical protein n=1 Tax=Streptomyces lavendulae TaxID=1914 RepID=UPI0036A6E72B